MGYFLKPSSPKGVKAKVEGLFFFKDKKVIIGIQISE